MVETPLVATDITDGQSAVRALDADRVECRSAFWLYFGEAIEYRLVFVLPEVDRKGSAHGYRLVQRAFLRHGAELPLSRVAVVGLKDRVPHAIHRVVGRAPADANGTPVRPHLGRRYVDGITIEDAYVYRSA